MGRKQTMPFREAMELVPDDLPDGAFWAMAHEIAGLEYGDGFDEIGPGRDPVSDRRSPAKGETAYSLTKRHRKQIEQFGVLLANDRYHWQLRKEERGAVIADWWPHKCKYRFVGEQMKFDDTAGFIRALKKRAAQS